MSRRTSAVNFDLISVGILASLILAPISARAQEPPVLELSGGYAFLAVEGDDLPAGVFASGSWRATTRIALVGEVAANFDEQPVSPGARLTRRAQTFLGGVRLNIFKRRRIEPFAQVLAGASHFDVRIWETEPLDPFFAFDIRLETTDFALQLGGGLNWWLHPRVGAQFAARYQRIFDRFDFGRLFPGHDADEFTLLAGATIGFGRKR
jgi:hypothetical protein